MPFSFIVHPIFTYKLPFPFNAIMRKVSLKYITILEGDLCFPMTEAILPFSSQDITTRILEGTRPS